MLVCDRGFQIGVKGMNPEAGTTLGSRSLADFGLSGV